MATVQIINPVLKADHVPPVFTEAPILSLSTIKEPEVTVQSLEIEAEDNEPKQTEDMIITGTDIGIQKLVSHNAVQKLHDLFKHWATLRSDSIEQEFTKFGDFFSMDAQAWLSSMRSWQSPSRGREAIIESIKQTANTYHYESQEFISELNSLDNRKAMFEIKARLSVLQHSLDNYETVIAMFDDQGLISDLKVYTCRSAVQMIRQHVFGAGPYNPEFQKLEWKEFFGDTDQAPEAPSATPIATDTVKVCCS